MVRSDDVVVRIEVISQKPSRYNSAKQRASFGGDSGCDTQGTPYTIPESDLEGQMFSPCSHSRRRLHQSSVIIIRMVLLNILGLEVFDRCLAGIL